MTVRPTAARGVEGIRVDDGVARGRRGLDVLRPDDRQADHLGADPRRSAPTRRSRALDAFEIEGLGHNIDFLSALMQHPRFRSGELTTGFIAEEYPDGFHGAPAIAELKRVARRDRRLRRDAPCRPRAAHRRAAGRPLCRRPADWRVRIDGTRPRRRARRRRPDGRRRRLLDWRCEYTPGDRTIDGRRIDGEDDRRADRQPTAPASS